MDCSTKETRLCHGALVAALHAQCFSASARPEKMKNHLKVLLAALCLGSLCVLLFNGYATRSYEVAGQDSKGVAERSFARRMERHLEERELAERRIREERYEVTAEIRARMEREFQSRKYRVELLCENLEYEVETAVEKALANVVIDPEHGLTWCPIYKSASSMWMRNFAALSGFSGAVSLHSQHSRMDYSSIVRQKFQHDDVDDEKKLQEISMTNKFIVVRHPFERLLSAYRDKLEHMQGREYYYKRYGQYITQKYRAKQSNLTSLEPSFTEFLDFIAKEKRFDEHWVPYFDSCQPCSIDYDYIFKFESLSSEYNFFIKENNLDNYLNYSKGERENTSSQGVTNEEIAEKYFQEVPAELLLDIFKIYELDFLLFSYSPVKYYFMTKDGDQEKSNLI